MKGIVFVEFVDMVADMFSEDMVDEIIDAADLPSGGSYTSVGTYSHEEMLGLVTALSKKIDTPVPDLVHIFGKHLLGRFVQRYPAFFEEVDGAFAFIQTIENHIHEEVLKLYPEAELPELLCEELSETQLKVTYNSTRPFASLAQGLLEACVEHYGENIELKRLGNGDSESHAEFVLTKNG